MTASLLELQDALSELREAEKLLNTRIRALQKLPCSPWLEPSDRAAIKPAFSLLDTFRPTGGQSGGKTDLPKTLSSLLRKPESPTEAAEGTEAAAAAAGSVGELSEEAAVVAERAGKIKSVCDQALREAAEAEKLEVEIGRLAEESAKVFAELEEAEMTMPSPDDAPMDVSLDGAPENNGEIAAALSSDLRVVYSRAREELVLEGPEREKALVAHLFEGLPRRLNWWSKPLCEGPNLHELVEAAREIVKHAQRDAAEGQPN
ncbi:hypothetical protein FOZ61_004705 [Perkinsus olseni]|uniref:Uncharacterized protein n=1 Tax=Perkinsus olseni TaxID=32597 RepID=A0A7J6LJL7_PEROL|nr:hypothetical protein FOZ61_004705 [Perkinsus olseni]KAF4664069.1 hypothetical protein FOL46_004443 [Perkinsus olseni]